jgi:beta-glucosidase
MAATDVRYRDASLPAEVRAADLLARMTLGEKVAQLGSAWSFELVGRGSLDPARARALLGQGIGHVSRVAGASNADVATAAALGNEIQRFLAEETRLGIPAILHEETLHGVLGAGAPVFQQSIGAAASFDPAVVSAMAATLRRRMLLMGGRHALAPVLDTARDPRWGRIEETYGEDPYLATVMGLAYVEAMQGPSLADGVAATAKHMVGHGLAEGGMNQAPVHAGRRELEDEQLAPFEAAVREGRIASIMPAYCDVDGVPCHASAELLDDVLRRRWGFDGIVASDYMAVEMLSTAHRLTGDLGVAAGMALRAGVDAELPSTSAYGAPLLSALADGRVRETDVDAAVERVLRLKLRLGLFERPFVDVPEASVIAGLEADEDAAALELAERSIVLVENDGLLPLGSSPGRVAVVGPLADSARDLIGDYGHLLHLETLNEGRLRAGTFGFPLTDPLPVPDLAGAATILSGLRARFGEDVVTYARGTGIGAGSDEELEAAVAAAAEADVALVVLGERSGLTDDATTGEFRDRSTLGLLGRQQELLERVVATGTPCVLIVVSGRPLALPWAAEHCRAVVMAWVPGDAGPRAIARVLAGDVAPGGKLPVSVPRTVGQVPLTYRHHPTGGRSNPKGPYVDGPTTPLWPFGHGRSYTTFALANLAVDRPRVQTDGGTVDISVEVTNTGDRRGDEVVQLYVRDLEAPVARPVLELRGFRRITLEPGECRRVRFELAAQQLAFTGIDYRRVVEPGDVAIQVGASSADLALATTITLAGPVVEVPVRTRFVTPSSVE